MVRVWTCIPASWPRPPGWCVSWWMRSSPGGGPWAHGVDSAGTVNAIFRVGDDLAARLPLGPGDPGPVRRQLECEARAARELAGRTRFATPGPVALGAPGAGYPLGWLVQTWLPGLTATNEDPGRSAAFAHDLAGFVGGVRGTGTGGRTFSGSGRGGDLASHDEWMQTCFARSGQLMDVPALRRMWDVLRELPHGEPLSPTHAQIDNFEH
jgi:aminoglycoside phosphotransferase (APT) family kinase protein